MDKIPVSVIVTTKNEEANIARCLSSLSDFTHIMVVDSHSTDRTVAIARHMGAEIVNFTWNGTYPKKRQWCLDTLAFSHDWVFWVDADEVLTSEIIAEIRSIFAQDTPRQCGFFMRGRYIFDGRALSHGMVNNKIALFDRRKMAFPIVNDLNIEGMGEMEGHYQPVRKNNTDQIGQIKAPLLHYAYEDQAAWQARHERYAKWEAEMIRRDLYPPDPVAWRQALKIALRGFALRPYVVFLYCYVLRCGFLDGKGGLSFALSRAHYCFLIRRALRTS